MTPIQKARAAGLSTYIGRPCKWGHSGERYTSHSGCVACAHNRQFERMQPKDGTVINTAVEDGKFMGAPCFKGHDGLRYQSNYTCVHCHRARKKPQKPTLVPAAASSRWDDLLG